VPSGLSVARFLNLLFAGLALAPALAHLLELPNKIGLPREDYLTVQQIYRGWALLGIVVFGALFSTLVHAVLVRRQRRALGLVLVALACLAGAQAVFWTFTFPANELTQNWTALPEDWAALRARWEYSHAAGAVLNLAAFVVLILSVLVAQD
jgi:hypothetical protein